MADFKSIIDKGKSFWLGIGAWLREKLHPVQQRYVAFKTEKPRSALAFKITFVSALSGILFLFIFCLMIYLGAFGRLPNYGELKQIQHNVASEVYSDDGVLLGKYYVENRINADFEEISPNIINALVATEDVRFFEHSGIDFRAWIRVFFRTLLMQDASGGGGSTLSQQLAKNVFPRQRLMLFTTPIAKVKEMFIARRLENIYSKQELLNLYLNTVPFSENIFGVKVASQRFFNTSPKEINVEDAAVLVGMLKGTSLYNPLKNPERARLRRNVVMGQMVKYEYLDQAAYDSLSQKKIGLNYYREGSNQGLGTYFREHLRLEVSELLKDVKKENGESYNLYTDGLKIYTTINSALQQYAEESVKEQITELQAAYFKHWKGKKSYGDDQLLKQAKQNSKRYKRLKESGLSEEEIDTHFDIEAKMTIYDWETQGDRDTLMSPTDSLKYYLSILNTGFLAIDPHSGKTLAWVGGVDHEYFYYDHVKSKRQIGSTFKPVVYAKAIESGIPPCEYIDNLLTQYTQFENWQPRNSDGKYGGIYSMEGALSKSVNVVTVDLIMRTGIDSVKMLAERLGIAGDIPEVPSISLGTMDASLYEMVKMYGTFANRGLRPEIYYLKRIETANGEVLINFDAPNPDEFERVLSVETTDILVKIMRSVVDSGTAKRLRFQYGLYNQIAGKTGTTQRHSDGWFMGFTPNLVAGVWVGGTSPKIRFRSMKLGQGSKTALPIWGRFMNKVYKDPQFKKWKKLEFPEPDSLTLAELNCPPYLPDRSYLEEAEEEIDIFDFDWIKNLFNKNEESRENVSPRRKSNGGGNDRIRKQNEKLERKRRREKRRKEFVDKLKRKIN